ncbi:MAG: hypothetical protein IJY76_01495, partial [Anaerotignum sp.]|nr:hypothetical protein [Anaerotignum sp.]
MNWKMRLISMLLVIAMLFAFSGCAGEAAPEQNAASSEEPSVEAATEPAAEEYTEPLMDGYNQITFYWSYPGTYENCDMWIWIADQAGKGYPFHECEYGAKVIVNVPEDVEEVGFIVRRDCSDPGGTSWGSATKDYEQDRFAKIEGKETVVYLKTGDPTQYYSTDGGKTLETSKKFTIATMADEYKLQYRVTPAVVISDVSQVKVFEGDREIAVSSLSALGKEAASGYIELEEPLDLTKIYTVSIEGYGEKTAVPGEIFDSKFFADNFHYDGNDLGAVIQGKNTTFKVWAPTASSVV